MGKHFGLCWCISGGTKMGTLVIGIIEIIISSILLLGFTTGACLAFSGKLLSLIKGQEESTGPTFYHSPWTDPYFVVLIIFALLFVCSLSFAIALVIGVKKGVHGPIKNWMKFKIFILTIFFVLSLQYILIVRFSDLIFLIVDLSLFLLNLYFYWVVKTYCKKLKRLYYQKTFEILHETRALKLIDPKSIV